MKQISGIILSLFSNLLFGQAIEKKADTELLLNYFLQMDTISKITYDYADNITSYQFEGDYSRKKVFPNASENTLICASPIRFEEPIYKTLQQIDVSYDSLYYQNQIHSSGFLQWTTQNLQICKNVKFIKSRLIAKLYRETNMFSLPLYSKDGQIAIMTFSSVNRKFVIKKREKVFVFKKMNNSWELVKTISSAKTW